MNIWLITIGEQLPITPNIRKLRTAYLADELVARGHSVLWWCSAFNHFKKEWIAFDQESFKINDCYEIVALKGTGYKKNISFARILDHRILAKKFRRQANLRSKPDVIVVSMPTYELAYEATRYGKQYNVPVLIDIRDPWPELFVSKSPLPEKLSRLLLMREFQILKKALRQSSGILSVTNTFLDWALKYVNRDISKQDRVFHLGYKKGKLLDSAVNEKFQKILDSLKRKFVITFIGTFEPTSDAGVLVECAKLLQDESDLHFVIAGDGSQREKIVQAAQGLNNVTFAGWLGQQEIDLLLAHSKVGVCSAGEMIELFPNKAFLYFAFGLPIVSAFQGDLKELVFDEGVGFYYPPRDAVVLAQHIKTLQNEPIVYQEKSANSARVFEHALDGNIIYKNFAEHIEQLATLHKRQ